MESLHSIPYIENHWKYHNSKPKLYQKPTKFTLKAKITQFYKDTPESSSPWLDLGLLVLFSLDFTPNSPDLWPPGHISRSRVGSMMDRHHCLRYPPPGGTSSSWVDAGAPHKWGLTRNPSYVLSMVALTPKRRLEQRKRSAVHVTRPRGWAVTPIMTANPWSSSTVVATGTQ